MTEFKQSTSMEILIDALPNGVIIASVDTGGFLFTNPSIRRMFGYSKEEFLKLNPFHLHPQEAHEEVKLKFKGMLAGEVLSTYNLKAIHRDGSVFWVDFHAVFIDWNKEKCIFAVFSDVTARVLQETESKLHDRIIQMNNERFNLIAEHSKIVAWETDMEGLYTYLSSGSEIVYGFTADELIGEKHFYDLHPQRGRDAFREACLEMMRKGESFRNLINPILCKNGEVIHCSTSAFPMYDSSGNPIGYRGSDRDISDMVLIQTVLKENQDRLLREISEKRRNEVLLKKQNSVLRDITWEQSHMARAPLARLMGLIDILESDDWSGTSRQEILNSIHKSTQELDSIIREITKKLDDLNLESGD